MHVPEVAAYLPEHTISRRAKGCSKAVHVRGLEIDGPAFVVRGFTGVHVVVCRYQPYLVTSPSSPDVGQVEHAQ